MLREYCERFFGYGAWNTKIWFVGMEEGGKGSSSALALNQRLEIWKRRGKRELESAPEFYGHLDYAKEWFGLYPNIPCFAMIHPTREIPEYFVNVGKYIKAVCNL